MDVMDQSSLFEKQHRLDRQSSERGILAHLCAEVSSM
ncbi:hypothetical protein HY17_13175 [Hyphomonas sp. CY54-11-8]|nr:hypothetical protein HY17_13175 [Hyphomonas sp. CY54-11-8]